jgi:hypothetical protein
LHYKTNKNMEEKDFSPEASIALIQAMIGKTKTNISNNSFYYIFWGWLVFTAALVQYISIKVDYPYGSNIWLLMPIGAVVTIIYSIKNRRNKIVKTHIDGFLKYLWIGFGLALFLTLVSMGIHGVKTTYFFLMVLYGLVTFIAGGVLAFPPLVFGGLCSLTCAVLSVFLNDENQLLCIALALLLSYIVPGHLLALKHKQQ